MARVLSILCAVAVLIVPCIAQDSEYKPPRKWTFGTMGVAMRADLEVYQGGARDEAGEIVIKEKDRLLKWNGTELKTLDDFCRQLYATKPGDIVEVELSRPCPTLEGSEPSEREVMTVKIKLADPKVTYQELYTNLDKRTRSYDWRKEEAVTKGGPLRDKLLPRIEKHKLTGQWDNLLAAHERELDLWNSYENLSSTDLLLRDPMAAHGWISAVGKDLAAGIQEKRTIEGTSLMLTQLMDQDVANWEQPIPAPGGSWAQRAQDCEKGGKLFDHRDLGPEQFVSLQNQIREAQFAWRGDPGFENSALLVERMRAANLKPHAVLPLLDWSIRESAIVLQEFYEACSAGDEQSDLDATELAKFVEGDAFAFRVGSSVWAVGGTGRNVWKGGEGAPRVTMDLGGDDEYVDCACTAQGELKQFVIDQGGNDLYRATGKWGIACGMLGVAVIDDHEGNDTYECGDWGIGAAFGGIGLLIDRKGNDRYLGGTNSIGCAAYGVGGVIDLEGNDLYDSHTMSVGVGQPGGVGFVLDHAGDDRYRCNGKEPSGYGTEGEWTGWGIGCGFGWRTLACGGIGLVVDVKGNDIYDAGEFGLGCGYFMAIGAVRDMDGDDIYHSSRYGLAAAAHAGVGLFMDDKGNDTYEGKTAASIGGVWDIVTGYFYDGAGDDNYRCDGLGLGACAMNGFGIFWDAGGSDNYRGGASTIGNAGGAEYGGGRLAKNFGIFMDSGGGKDNYPREDRKDNTELVEQEYAIFWDE